MRAERDDRRRNHPLPRSGTARMNASSTERRLRNGTVPGRVKRSVRYRARTPGALARDARSAATSKSSVVRSGAVSSDASFGTMSGSPSFPTIRSSPARVAVTSTSGACRCGGSGASPPTSGATRGRRDRRGSASRPSPPGVPPPTTTCGPRRTARTLCIRARAADGVEQLAHALLHPQRELLVRLALARVDRPPVPNADRRPPPPRPRAPLRHRRVRAHDRDRHHRHLHVERQPRRPVAEPLEPPVGRTRPLGEHDDVPPVADQLLGLGVAFSPAPRSTGNPAYTSAVNAERHHTSKK